MKTDLKFGERIKIKGYISRGSDYEKGGNYRKWERYLLPEPVEGIFLRYIRLANGKIDWEYHGEDGGNEVWFVGEEYIDGAWVCKVNRSPEKVFLSDCEKI